MNVFKRHLGEHFSALSPLIQQIHIGTMEGNVYVRHENFFAQILCRVLNMPVPGETVKLVVEGYHERHSTRWNRFFDRHKMQSNFPGHGKFLIERLRSLKLWLKLEVDDNGTLNYLLERVSQWRINTPKRLALLLMNSVDGPSLCARKRSVSKTGRGESNLKGSL